MDIASRIATWADVGGIPSAYEEVDYLESSGTQYIDTGVIADSNLSVECNMANAGTPWTNVNPMGAILASPRYRHHLNFSDLDWTRYFFGYGNDCVIPSYLYFQDGVFFTFKVDVINQLFTLDNFTAILPSGDWTTGLNYWLFARNGAVYYGKLMIAFCKMWQGSTLVRDYRSVVRRADSKPGMYDLVTRQFFVNQGTGADFTYG